MLPKRPQTEELNSKHFNPAFTELIFFAKGQGAKKTQKDTHKPSNQQAQTFINEIDNKQNINSNLHKK